MAYLIACLLCGELFEVAPNAPMPDSLCPVCVHGNSLPALERALGEHKRKAREFRLAQNEARQEAEHHDRLADRIERRIWKLKGT